MTDWLRFSWLSETGAPSRSGVILPIWTGGFKVFCIEKFLPMWFSWIKSIKIMPENYKNNQHFSVILELHF